LIFLTGSSVLENLEIVFSEKKKLSCQLVCKDSLNPLDAEDDNSPEDGVISEVISSEDGIDIY